jgi:hypothetical protein
MEIFAFIAVILAIVVALLWRSRSGVTRDPDSAMQGVPNDLRNKFGNNTGYIGGFGGGGDGDAGGGGGMSN